MAAGLVVPVSGPYSGTWGGGALGVQNDDGFQLVGTYQGQEINATDAYGMTLVEAIWRGLNWRIRFRAMEFNKTGILLAIQAFGGGLVSFAPLLESVGDRFTKFADPLVLTSILGVYPPTMPTTLTATNAIIAPQSTIELLLTSKVREAPLEMVLLPYNAVVGSSNIISTSFTTT